MKLFGRMARLSDAVSNKVLLGTTMLVVGVGLTLAVVAMWIIITPTPVDPFQFDVVRIQEVNSDGTIEIPQVPGYSAPSVYLNQAVPLVFVYCSSSEKTLKAVGNSWFVDATHGYQYPLNTGLENDIRPGCITVRTTVDVPDQLRADLEDLPGGDDPLFKSTPWYIEGELTPQVDGGVTATWRSEVFLVVSEKLEVSE